MLKSLADIAARWNAVDTLALLGPEAYFRARLIIEIDELLHSYFGAELADNWIFMKNKNQLFDCGTPLSYMMREEIFGMVNVAKLLRGMCQHG